MSVAEKQLFLDKVRTSISGDLTGSQLEYVMTNITGIINGFDLIPVEQDLSAGATGDMIEAFIAAKEVEGRSPKTIERYRYCISKMLKYLNTPIESINVYHIRKYLMAEKQRGISDGTINGYRDVFGSLFGWLHNEGLIQKNPIANIGPIKCEKKIKKPFSDIDVERLKECCGTERNRAIFFFLLSTGCRISEMCELDKDDINFQTLECIVHGKGNKQRTVFLSNVAAMMLKRYLDKRTDDSHALFVGKGSNRLQPGGVRFMLKKVAAKAGIENVHPHRCRRTLATSLIDHGMQVQDVAFILGHEKLDTTMKYVYMSQQNVKNAYRKFAS